MPDKAALRLRRVTDLFTSGRELVIGEDDQGEPVLIWLAKLNTFQRGECHRDGEAAQARRVAALGEDSDEIRAANTQFEVASDEEIFDFILANQGGSFYLKAQDDVRAEEGWREKITLLERDASLEEGGSPATDEEREAITKVQLEYLDAIEAARQRRWDDAKKDLADLDRDELHRRYLDTARSNMAEAAFWQEFRRTELYLSVRDCTATRSSDGYDHSSCTHARLLVSRAGVNDIPQELLDRIRQGLSDLNATPTEAGNSAAPQTSSGSVEQPSSAEGSAPSSQPET